MKSFILVFTFFLFTLSPFANGQTSDIPKTQSSIDVGVGFGKDLFSGAASWNRTHGINASNKLRLGYGVRASLFSGKNLAYTTAPAKLAADLTKVDTLNIASASTIGLNALINIQYKISKKIALGFNIDAVGVGFGSATDGNFISSDNKNNTFATKQSSKPTSLNLLLVGNNDIGQLKSEIYAEVMATEKLGIRAGLDLTFSEYTTPIVLTQNNDRFRYKANLIMLSISYKL